MLDKTQWLGKAGFLARGSLAIYVSPSGIESKKGQLPVADIVLVTHNHPDHCSVPDVESVSVAQTIVAGPPECVCRFRLNQLPLVPGQTKSVLGIPVTMTKTGFVFEMDGVRAYHPGAGEPEADIRADIVLMPGKGAVVAAAQ